MVVDYPDWQRAFRLVGTEITLGVSIDATTVTLNVAVLSSVTLNVDITAQTVGNLNVNVAASAITLNVNVTNATLNVDITAQSVGNLNVNLAASAITLNVNIAASAVTLNVNLSSQSAFNLDVNIAASAITLNVNLSSSSITLNVNLTSQSVNINIDFADQSVAVFDAAKWFAKQAVQVFIFGTATVNANSAANVATRTVPAGKTFFIVGVSMAIQDTAAYNNFRVGIVIGVTVVQAWGSLAGGSIILDTPIRATAGQTVNCSVRNNHATNNIAVIAGFWGYDE